MSGSGPKSEDKVCAFESWRVSTGVFCRALFIGTEHEIKHLPFASIEMAPANDAEPQRRASGCTSVHSAEIPLMQQAELESKHVWSHGEGSLRKGGS